MKKLTLTAMALFLAVSATMAQSEAITAKYNEAAAAFQENRLEDAIAAFDEVITNGMDDDEALDLVTTAKTYLPTCYYKLGLNYAKVKDFDNATANLIKSAEYAELYDAIADMNKAKNLAGKVYQAQGGAAFNSQDYATAVPVFEKGCAMDPRNTQMANWLGISYCETGELQKGMDIFAKIAAMGSSNPKYADDAEEAKKNMGIYINNKVAELQANKDYDGVITMADDLLTSNPSNATAAMVRLQAYMDKKDYNKVIELGEGAAMVQTSDEEKSNVYFIVGAAYNAKEMKNEAIAAFRKVVAGVNAATAQSTISELTSPAK